VFLDLSYPTTAKFYFSIPAEPEQGKQRIVVV
jgi:hypothetical protein